MATNQTKTEGIFYVTSRAPGDRWVWEYEAGRRLVGQGFAATRVEAIAARGGYEQGYRGGLTRGGVR